jgi:hypothetical protein
MELRISVKANRSWSGILLICYFGWSLERVRLGECTTSGLNLFVRKNVETSFCVEDDSLTFEQKKNRSYRREKVSNFGLQSKLQEEKLGHLMVL